MVKLKNIIKVLIVEDDPLSAKLLQGMIVSGKSKKYNVKCCGTLQEADRLISNEYFDVVLLDLSLPDSRGLDTLIQLSNQHTEPAIIVTTGAYGEEFGEKAVAAGASDYLLKGEFDVLLLQKTIRYAIQRKAAEKALLHSEIRFSELFNHMSSGVAVYEPKNDGGRYIFKAVNKACERIENVKRENILGKSVQAVFPGIKKMGLLDVFYRVWKTGKPECQTAAFYKDKRITGWRESYVYKLQTGEIVTVYDDVTERKKNEEEIRSLLVKSKRIIKEVAMALSFALEQRDPYTAGHGQRVGKLAYAIAKEMKLSNEQIEGLRIAGLLHDIGKIRVPSELLSKSGGLSISEMDVIKMHAQVGYDILKNIEFEYPIADIVLQHHERMNGSGYPRGLRRENILIESRIIGVSDVVEAMTSHRPYRPAQSLVITKNHIVKFRAELYDAAVVDAFVRVIRQKNPDLTWLYKAKKKRIKKRKGQNESAKKKVGSGFN